MTRKLSSALLVALAVPAAAWSQVPCEQNYRAQQVLIPLDATGISNWRYLNPRQPYVVVAPPKPITPGERANWEKCAELATVTFINNASQALVVTIPYVYRRIDVAGVADELTRQDDHVRVARATLNRLAAKPGGASAKALVETAVGWQPNQPGLFQLVGDALMQLRALAGARSERGRMERTADAGYADSQTREKTAAAAAGTSIHTVILSSEALRLGIASWKKTQAATADVEVVSAMDLLNDELQRLEAWLRDGLSAIDFSDERPPLAECGDATATTQDCALKFTLFDSGTAAIPPETWKRMVRFSDGVVRFKVAFFDEQFAASNTDGFLRVRTEARERESATTWSVTAAVGYSEKPETDRKREDGTTARPFLPTDPYTGRTVDNFTGSARLDLVQTLKDRGRARVRAAFEGGRLGDSADAKEGRFTSPLYTVDVFGVNAVSLRFGRYTLLEPARAAAISVTGEGFQLSRHNVTVGHVVTLDSARGTPKDANENKSVSILRVSGARGFGPIKHFDFFALYGDNDEKDKPAYDYNTLGAQFFFAGSPPQPTRDSMFASYSGSVSYFHSDRDVRNPGSSALHDGTGQVLLLDAGVTLLQEAGLKTKPLRTFAALLGKGTGDDPSSSDRDESFLGETAAFTGDSLFLSTYPTLIGEGASERPPLGKGLANKFYLGTSYIERSYKPINLLWWFARGMRVADDVKAAATTMRAHWFRLDEPFQERHDAGYEAGLQWQIEVPEGVTSSLGCNRYFPGKATRNFFDAEPMSCSAQVTLTLR